MNGEESLAPRALVAMALFLGLIAGMGVAALYLGLTRLNPPSLSRAPVHDIDVSRSTGSI